MAFPVPFDKSFDQFFDKIDNENQRNTSGRRHLALLVTWPLTTLEVGKGLEGEPSGLIAPSAKQAINWR